MQKRFLLQILLLAQHVSGITMPIIRSSRVLYSGCCLWYLVLWCSSCWSGVGLRVMCPVCRMLQHPANRTHNPQLHTRPATWKTTARNTTGSNHCIIPLSSWWWAWWCPKHVEQAIRSAIKNSVASSWHFISTYVEVNYWNKMRVKSSSCLFLS